MLDSLMEELELELEEELLEELLLEEEALLAGLEEEAELAGLEEEVLLAGLEEEAELLAEEEGSLGSIMVIPVFFFSHCATAVISEYTRMVVPAGRTPLSSKPEMSQPLKVYPS